MRIGIDVDGVLADFNSAYIKLLKALPGQNLFPEPYTPDTWYYPEKLGYSKAQIDSVWADIKVNPYFWRDLEPYNDDDGSTADTIREWMSKHDVYFITARPGVSAKRQTEHWLQAYLEPLSYPTPTVLVTSDKAGACEILSLDHYIDDRRSNIVDCATFCVHEATGVPTVSLYLLDRQWNQDARHHHPIEDYPNVVRVASIAEMDAIMSLQRQHQHAATTAAPSGVSTV